MNERGVGAPQEVPVLKRTDNEVTQELTQLLSVRLKRVHQQDPLVEGSDCNIHGYFTHCTL